MIVRVLSFAAAVLAVSVASSDQAFATERHTVRIISDYDNLSFRFEPKVLEVNVGDTVVWINDVTEEHNVMTYPAGRPRGAAPIESPLLASASETFEFTFDVVGTYQYHCMPHLLMGMNGEIVVGRRSTNSEFHQPTKKELEKYRAQLIWWFGDDDNLMHTRMDHKAD